MMNRLLLTALILYFKTSFNNVLSTSYTCSPRAPCGCSANVTISARIVGGEIAIDRTWGWAASLRSSSTGSHFCGGSIISNSHILTAAHCTDKKSPSSIRIHVGTIYLYSTVQIRDVSKIYNHPLYSSSTFLNDISIIKLSSPLNLDQTGVDRVCLPNISSTILAIQKYPPVNIDLVAIGWGTLEENSQTISSILQQVTLQSISPNGSYCEIAMISDQSTQFCAGVTFVGGKDTCQGDSGGPLLMFTSNNVWEQVGITSFGYGCAKPSLPGIYTRVAAYQSWINATMNNANHLFIISYAIFIPLQLLILL